MTTQAKPNPVDLVSDDADVAHDWCCDENVAMCGADLRGAEVADNDTDVPDCPMCQVVLVNNWACPVRGCTLRRRVRDVRDWLRGRR